ncbi:YncE family protein [Kitasatospora viridis]|nr:YncE family protein [Kitasatospora viridis]
MPPSGPLLGPDGRRAYAVAQDADGHTRLRTVSTAHDRVIATLDLGLTEWTRDRPALSADGSRLYVVNGETLSVIDTTKHKPSVVSSLVLPDEPRPTGWGPGVAGTVAVNGSLVYLAQDGPAPGTSAPTAGRVWVYDTARQAVIGSVQLPGGQLLSIAVRPDGRSAYVSTEVGIVHLDTSTAVPTVAGTVPGSAGMDGLALSPDGTALYAVNDVADGTGLRVDPGTDTVTARLTLTDGYSQLAAPVVSADGTRLYVPDAYPAGHPAVLAFDTATGAALPSQDVTGFALTDFGGLALAPNSRTLYATGQDRGGSALQILAY